MSVGGNIDAVSMFDPAIDRRAPKAAEYTLYRDMRHVPAITWSGMTPAVFTLGKLTRAQWKLCQRQAHEVDKHEMAFVCGVRRVTGMDGSADTWNPSIPNDMTGDELGLFGFLTVEEIGKVVLQIASTPKGSKPLFLRSPLCLSAWGAMESEHPSVAPSPPKPPPSSANP